MTTKVNGTLVKIGDYVCFKSGYEQCAKIVAIKGDMLVLEKYDEYDDVVRTQQMADDCWLDN